MKRILILALAAVMFAVPAFSIETVCDFEQNSYSGDVGDELVTTLDFFAPSTADTLEFCRLLIDYDDTKVTLTDIVNGADVPSYSDDPFINWSGSGDAEVIWLGLFNTSGQYQWWEGDAFDLTWDLDAAVTNSLVSFTENGSTDQNYIDLQDPTPSCVNDFRLRYTKSCGGSQCGTGTGDPSPGKCIETANFYGTKITIYDLMSPEGTPSKDKDRPELSPGKAKQDRAAWVAAFNVRQEARINALSPKMQTFVRDALAGKPIDPDEYRAAAVENSTWSETKKLYR